MRGKFLVVLAAIAVVACGALEAQARGRGRSSSPYVKTPFGLIPKSVYNAPFVQNPQKLEQYRQAEQKAAEKMGGTTGTKPTATKPSTAKKKK
jgi:hypothetical protein